MFSCVYTVKSISSQRFYYRLVLGGFALKYGWFWVVSLYFGWFWVVLGGFGSFWVVLGGFVFQYRPYINRYHRIGFNGGLKYLCLKDITLVACLKIKSIHDYVRGPLRNHSKPKVTSFHCVCHPEKAKNQLFYGVAQYYVMGLTHIMKLCKNVNDFFKRDWEQCQIEKKITLDGNILI